MAQHQHSSQHLFELQIETLKHENVMLKRENEMLKRDNEELREMYNAMKQSLDEAVRESTQQADKLGECRAHSEATEDNVDQPQGMSIHSSHSCSVCITFISSLM